MTLLQSVQIANCHLQSLSPVRFQHRYLRSAIAVILVNKLCAREVSLDLHPHEISAGPDSLTGDKPGIRRKWDVVALASQTPAICMHDLPPP